MLSLAVFACSVALTLGAWNGPLAGGLPAHQYPAGVSPQACPNFPHCSNPSLAANPNAPAPIHAQSAWNAQPSWNGGQQSWNGGQQSWNGGHQQGYGSIGDPLFTGAYAPHNAVESGQYVGDGDYKGEGLPESGAYGPHPSWTQNAQPAAQQWGGHNQWNHGGAWNQAPAWNSAPVHAVPAQIPAGVDAHSCPNYPFCHA